MNCRDEIQAMVREAYARRCAGDLDGFMAALGPNPRFRIAGDAILGKLTEEARGRKAVREALGLLIANWGWKDYRIDDIMVDGERAVAHGKGNMVYLPSGKTYVTETLDLLTIADGKIDDFLEFCDTHMAARAMKNPRPRKTPKT